MKKQTVFVNLDGYIRDYVKRIIRKSKTGDVQIQKMHEKLNVTISTMGNLPATAENCKKVWDRLTEVVYNSGVKNTEYDAYKEIINAVDEIGNKIAYIVPRTGIIYPKVDDIGLARMVVTDEDRVQTMKTIFLNGISYAKECGDTFDETMGLYKTDDIWLKLFNYHYGCLFEENFFKVAQ